MTQSFNSKQAEIIVVRPDPHIITNHSLSSFVGLSATTAGTQGIAMEFIILPPGAIAKPHLHPEHETVLYLLKGRVEVYYGEGLQQCQVCKAGDFIFTPPGVPHQPRNLSTTEPVYAIAARNRPDEQEESVPYIQHSRTDA
ncbi:MAG: cupin domain-containing protein [Leptolyngbyaceae cyanobacterium SU_3_3]|nr:cupin domain-containing protein [Leptolyngbyaceae cyanobacterium SU_3_3]NJR48349.1 cupin domain-containing protein [Leptolyngbyaceae cyanobacterium CSU_1_3]